MTMLNIVIHMLFASTGVLSVEWEPENKVNLWCRQEKSSNENPNQFPVNCRLCLAYIHLAAQNRFYLVSLASLH
jgi:hypothetical protein